MQTWYSGATWATQPSNTLLGSDISPAPVVDVVETDPTTNATDDVPGAQVTIAPGNGLALTSGTLTEPPAGTSGQPTAFGDLVPSSSGTGFTLSSDPITITGSNTLPSVTSNSFNVIGPVSQLVVSAPSTATAGTPFSITVTAEDASGNVVPSATGDTVSVYSNGLLLQTSFTYTSAMAGIATLNDAVTLTGSGNQTLTAELIGNPSIEGTSGNIAVSAAAPAKVVVSGFPTTVYAGQSETGTVTLEDQYGNVETASSGSVWVATSENATAILVPLNNGVGTFTASFATAAASQSITPSLGTYTSVAETGITVNPVPSYVVTTATDDASGEASNCPNGGGGGDCSLRDALAAAQAAGAGNITFSPTVFTAANTVAQNTITLTGGSTLTISSNTAIAGLTSGSGASLKNLVTVDGGGGNDGAFSVFTVNSGTTNASIAHLNIQGGDTSSQSGGGISNGGTLTVTGSTISDNSVGGGTGGGIDSYGTLTVADSTISGNHASLEGGGIFWNGDGSATLSNTIVAGNVALGGGSDADDDGAGFFTDNGGNLIGISGAGSGNIGFTAGTTKTGTVSAPPNPNLSQLDAFGGPTQTMLPLPGSPAICAGSYAAAQTAGISADQRGVAFGNTGAGGYCPAGSIDIGAVQTDYAIKFVQQPSTAVQNIAMSPAPTVELTENGSAFADGSDTVAIPLTLTTGSGTLSGGSASTSASTGIATYPALSVSLPGTGDVLTAGLTLNPGTTPATALSLASNPFNVGSAVTQLAFSTAPASTVTAGGNAGASVVVQEEDVNGALVTTAGDTITLAVTGPGGYSKTYTQAATAGVASFDLAAAQLTADGPYSYTASISTEPSVTDAIASETVGAAAAASVTVVSGSNQSAVIGAAFASPLTVKVEDQYNNPVQGATVFFSAPGSGAGASFSTPAATAADGTTSVTATANGTAGPTAYSVTASVAGVTTPASFMLTNTKHSTSLTVAPTSTALVYGQPVTVNASIVPASVSGSVPTGSVTFYDGSTELSPASNVSSAAASFAIPVPAVGSHTYAAQYGGDGNFQPSGQTSATENLVVSAASSTLNGPASESFPYGAGGTIAISVSGQYSGAGIATPSGMVSYTIGSGAVQTAPIVAGTATLTIPSTQAAGTDNVAVSYTGDGNYKAATAIQVQLTIQQATATIAVTPYSVTYDATAHTATGTATGVGGVNLAADLNLTATTHTAAGTYNGDAWSFHDPSGNYADASGTVNDHIGVATLTITAANATKVYGTANPAFTGTVTGQQGSDAFAESFTTGAVMSSPVGGYSIVPVVTGTNLADYTQSVTDGTLTVTQAGSSTILQASSASITPGQSVTLTATVLSATSGTPTGTVNFYDGTTLLNTTPAPLTAGVAAFSTAGLTPGAVKSITATYSGDVNFTPSSSTAGSTQITVAPLDFVMTLQGPSNLTVVPGQSISYTVQVTPDYGSYAGTVNFAIAGLPPGATVSFSPSSIAPNGGTQTVTVTIKTAAATAQLDRRPPSRGRRMAPFALGFPLLFGAGTLRKRGRKLRGLLCVLALAGTGAVAGLTTGCGTNSGFFAQAPQNYTVTLTATAANLQHSTTITLNCANETPRAATFISLRLLIAELAWLACLGSGSLRHRFGGTCFDGKSAVADLKAMHPGWSVKRLNRLGREVPELV